MSRTRLIREVADRTGSSFSDAQRFVSEVGADNARSLLRSADSSVSWRLPATGAVVGGTALGWRQQDVWRDQASADQSQAEAQTVEELLSSDLDVEDRVSLTEAALGAGSDDNGGLFEGLFGDDIQRTIVMGVVLLIIVVFVLNYAGNLGTQVGMPRVSVGGA